MSSAHQKLIKLANRFEIKYCVANIEATSTEEEVKNTIIGANSSGQFSFDFISALKEDEIMFTLTLTRDGLKFQAGFELQPTGSKFLTEEIKRKYEKILADNIKEYFNGQREVIKGKAPWRVIFP